MSILTQYSLTEGSLFAGIMGFGEGFRRAGFKNLWAVEKEPFCQKVIRARFSETEIFDDVKDCGKHNLRAVDVLTAGFPCQDLSVAGKRAGLEGARSGLFWEVVRIVGELRPTWFVLENVPGLFSSCEGRDFAIVLNALDELGYGLAWRVLNSQFFGVAQRRRRVFIVGRFGKPCPAEILFEPESGGGDIAESGEAWPGVAAEVTGSVGGAGRSGGFMPNADGFLQAVAYHENLSGNVAESDVARAQPSGASHSYQFVAQSLSASAGHHGHSSPRGDGSDNIIVQQAISSKWAKGSSGPAGDEHHNLQVCIQDARGQREKRQNGIGIQEGGPMYTLDGTSQHAVGSYLEHEKLARELGRDPRGDDEHDGGINDECSSADTHGMRGATEVSEGMDSSRFEYLPKGLDSARYRALGNAVTVSVAEWIARRILEQ